MLRYWRVIAERRELIGRTFLLCVTAFAINRPAFFRLKRDFAFLSAFCTGSFKRLAWTKIFSWASFAEISHVFSPNLHNKKVFRRLIQKRNYNKITSHYQDESFEIIRFFQIRIPSTLREAWCKQARDKFCSRPLVPGPSRNTRGSAPIRPFDALRLLRTGPPHFALNDRATQGRQDILAAGLDIRYGFS